MQAKSTDTILIHYTGYTKADKVFETTVGQGPVEIPQLRASDGTADAVLRRHCHSRAGRCGRWGKCATGLGLYRPTHCTQPVAVAGEHHSRALRIIHCVQPVPDGAGDQRRARDAWGLTGEENHEHNS